MGNCIAHGAYIRHQNMISLFLDSASMSENKKSVVNRKDRRKSWWGEQKKKEKKRDGMIPKIPLSFVYKSEFFKNL